MAGHSYEEITAGPFLEREDKIIQSLIWNERMHNSRQKSCVRIVELNAGDTRLIDQIAQILSDSFRGHCPDYDDLGDARKKVLGSFADHEISLVALDEDGNALGWVGGIRQYNGHVYELDPLVVKKDTQGSGVGRALVEDFERQVALRGADTIWLGTDDEDGRTSLSNVDLYPDVLKRAEEITNHGGHPYEFYARLGFVIVGVLPDANGAGKPDIYMAKRVERKS